MENSPIGHWFPFNIDWFRRASASWDPAWVMPVLNLLMDMWPNGCALENRDEVLARTARVSLKAWMDMRREMGAFWAVVDDKFTQPYLAAKYAEGMEKAAKRVERASKGGRAKQEKARERLAKDLAAQAALSSAASTTPSGAPSSPQASLEAHTRALVGSSSDQEEKEEQYASAVPKPEYIEACFRAYPRVRKGKGATARTVAIPEDARERIAAFLLSRHGYPLLEAFQVIARDHDFPPAMADFLAEPWDRETVLQRHASGAKPSAGAKYAGLVQAEAEAAKYGEDWDSLTEAEQEQRVREAEKRMGIRIGRQA